MTDQVLITAVLAFVGIGLGWLLGRRREQPIPPDPHPGALEHLAADLQRGSVGHSPPDEPTGVAQVRRAVEANWVPVDQSREEALKQALGRIAAFLEGRVQAPLDQVRQGDAALMREGIDRALGGLQDLEFHLREPLTPDETHNLVAVVQQVAREFIADSETGVRFAAPAFPVQARIHKGRFLDAVYLLLNNAGHFGEGTTVDVTIENDDGEATVTIRDRGPGFSAEALERAHDLFYTTRPEALGLGLPFARKIIEGFGGRIDLANHPEGGGVVTVTLPGV